MMYPEEIEFQAKVHAGLVAFLADRAQAEVVK